MRSGSCERKLGDKFFPERLIVDEFCVLSSRAKNNSSCYGSIDGLLTTLSICQRLIITEAEVCLMLWLCEIQRRLWDNHH
jgi:hypothetical protein